MILIIIQDLIIIQGLVIIQLKIIIAAPQQQKKSNDEESILSDIVTGTELTLDDTASMVDVTPIQVKVEESIPIDVTGVITPIIENDIDNPKESISDDVTSVTTAKEQNKGFGGGSTKKEKSKGSKKKKPNFSDL